VGEPEIVNRLVIPTQEAERLVAGAAAVYLRTCPCRLEMQVCPREKWEVCLLFEQASEEDRRKAKAITADEAVQIVRMAAGRGDIHQVFYVEGAPPHELCNCCSCCCFPLREAKERGDYAEQLHCAYVTVTDGDLCTACGTCLESCFFEARQLVADKLHLIDERCFGCGRCIPDCPAEAIRLEVQAGRGVPIPGV
jgi:Pyruvate/2-oxoacid:ferredoxin oxidoreductase delta subunit